MQSDEELETSVDDICIVPEVKVPAFSDASIGSGRISSLSSQGSSELRYLDAEAEEEVDSAGITKERLPNLLEGHVSLDETEKVVEELGGLNVEDEQEGTLFCDC